MKQTIKRALSLALALALSVTILLPSAWAEGESERIGTVTFSIETKTINGGYIVKPMEEELYADDTVYTILSRVAAEKNLAVEGADSGYVTKIEDFGSYTDSAYGLESGWMAAINNDHNTWPFPALKDGDTVRFCYTYLTYGYDIDLIDLIETLQGKVEEAAFYKGDNSKAVYAAMEESAEKLSEISEYGSNKDYLSSVNIYGSGSETEKVSYLIRKLNCALEGGEYVPATGATIFVSGAPSDYYVGRTYKFSASIEPENATISEGTWKVVEATGAGMITSDGKFTPTEAGYVTVQYWHPDAANGVLKAQFITIKASPAQVKIPDLLEGIASSYVDTYSNSKVIIDMAAYEDYNSSTTYKTTDAAKQNYTNYALSAITGDSVGDTIYALAIIGLQSIGVDPRTLYPVNSNTAVDAVAGLNGVSHSSSAWNAPYTLSAYNQGNYGTDTYEQTLIAAVLQNQKEDGSWDEWGDSIQTTANMITGLSFYYDTDATVKTAVDKAVLYLSKQQQADGTFDAYGNGADTDTCANVIMALASVGINPDTDARFIKNGNSALDGLLSFALTDNSGFGYQDNTTVNGYATEEAFRALIAAAQVMKTGEAYNIYDFSGNDVQPGRATGEGEVQKPSAPPEENDNITVTFSMKADTGYWVSPKSVTVKEGSTVYHVFTAALQNTGITYVGAENGYVSSITKDGKTLAEFTNGPDSSWLYKVNGELPDVGLTSYEVSNGDNIVWYYTNDWTKDSLAGQSAKPAEETITTTTTANSDGTITVTVTQGKETLDNVSGGVKVELPNKSGTGDVIVLVNKDGSETIVTKSLVEDETVYALLDGTCTVKIIDNAKDFSDVSDTAWYADAVDFVSGHELYNGTGNGAFSPNAPMSRAMLATVLYRLESEPESASDILAGFNDGADVSAWAQEGLSWAVANKVLEGTDGNCLAPNETVTREQLAVMIYRYAKLCGMDMTVSASTDISGQGVSSWAETAMAWAVENGIIEGGTGGKLNPQGPASRAEVAAILQRLVAVMVK